MNPALSSRLSVRPLALPPGFDLLALHRLHPARYPFLLESVAAGTPQARYDVLFAFPGETLVGGPEGGFLRTLDSAWNAERSPAPSPALPAFHGGWFLYLGYELAREIEPRLAASPGPDLQPPGPPVACATRVPVALVRDRAEGRSWAVAEPGHEGALGDLERDLATAATLPGTALRSVLVADLREPDPAGFLAAVAEARAAIAAGDIYQANLSRCWTGELAAGVEAWEVYARLRESNPAPFAAFARLPGMDLASSSPERLVRTGQGWIETRPIAGTRPRRQDAAPGAPDPRAELLAHPKERAEHVMLIDLERNDLGRVCEAGSVEVDEFMVVESYSHVHHIVSNIRGRLLPAVTPGQVIRAVFPGGTITGCPKVRCMSLIGALEGRPRGAYTGSLGYLNRDGSLDLNILIRTIVLEGRNVRLAAGSGIVADSDPERELEETRAKARGMLLALGANG